MTSPYSGSWARSAAAAPVVPVHGPLDPQHDKPDPNPNLAPGQVPVWRNAAPAPVLPDALMPMATPELSSGFGPVDHTPDDPQFGMGAGHGLTTLEAQDLSGAWHNVDEGAVAAHAWVHPLNSDTTVHLDVIPDMIGDGASPQTLQYESTGVGVPTDPGARRASRIRRWYQRYIDMHRYTVDRRPSLPLSTAPQQISAGGNSPYVSPFPTSTGFYAAPPDRFVAPQTRRAPGAWDESLATDGTAATVAGAVTDYGLTQYGL